MNLASSGARYFNRFGPADSQMETDALGRFCFFNVQPGLAEITVHKRNDYLTSFVMPLGAGLHVEEDVRLEEIDNITINLAGLPSFNQQVYGSRNDANRFSPVDFAELFIIGANRRLNFLENGLVDNDGENMDMFRNRIYLLNQSSEFEPVIYAVEGSDRSHPRDLIVPLLQRGFIEDLILELGSAGNVSSADLDASLGSMIIYLPKGVNPKAELSIKLFNSDGVEVEGGWYFGEQDPEMAKAVFYNLEKGFYLGVAQDRDGVWYGVNTIPVDYWTTSFMILGGNISK